MTVAELIQQLQSYPDDAVVYVEADHGQTAERMNSILQTDESELPYYGDDLNWEDIDFDGVNPDNATAINLR